jgi:RNA polymerase sigma factor (sigma-70 family)
MDYAYIESLILSSKAGDEKSKEKLMKEFKPFILNFSKKTFIDGYDFQDIQNECYIILLHAIDKYNPEAHRFVAYATNAIKNSMYAIIKKSNKNKNVQGLNTLTFDGDISSLNVKTSGNLDDNLNYVSRSSELLKVIDSLTPSEKELLVFNIFKQNSLKSYAQWKNVSSSTATNRKMNLRKKLQRILN